MSVLKKSPVRPVTPEDLKMSTNYKGMSIELIAEGHVLKQNLKQINQDENWLLGQLKQRGVTLEQVAYGTIDTDGRLYLDLYKDEGIKIIDISDYEGPN